MADRALIATGLVGAALTQSEKVTISVFEYKIWANNTYHFAASDLATAIGIIAGITTVTLILIKIKKSFENKDD